VNIPTAASLRSATHSNLQVHHSQYIDNKLNIYISFNKQQIFCEFGARVPRIRNFGISWLSVGIENG
jgi:hypothetical protein